MKKTIKFLPVLLVIGLFMNSCGNGDGGKGDGKDSTKAEAPDTVKELLGAGATFPYPLYSKLFDEYNKKTGTKVNYQSIGSGGGIKQLQSKTVDFGASDAPMSDEELSKSAAIVHIPTCMGADVITYNLNDIKTLQFTPDIVAGIF